MIVIRFYLEPGSKKMKVLTQKEKTAAKIEKVKNDRNEIDLRYPMHGKKLF